MKQEILTERTKKNNWLDFKEGLTSELNNLLQREPALAINAGENIVILSFKKISDETKEEEIIRLQEFDKSMICTNPLGQQYRGFAFFGD